MQENNNNSNLLNAPKLDVKQASDHESDNK